MIIVHVRFILYTHRDKHKHAEREREKERLGKVSDACSMIGTLLLKLKVRINEGDLLALSTRANSYTQTIVGPHRTFGNSQRHSLTCIQC